MRHNRRPIEDLLVAGPHTLRLEIPDTREETPPPFSAMIRFSHGEPVCAYNALLNNAMLHFSCVLAKCPPRTPVKACNKSSACRAGWVEANHGELYRVA